MRLFPSDKKREEEIQKILSLTSAEDEVNKHYKPFVRIEDLRKKTSIPKNKILVHLRHGLANRLLTLAGSIVLSRQLNIPISVYWPINDPISNGNITKLLKPSPDYSVESFTDFFPKIHDSENLYITQCGLFGHDVNYIQKFLPKERRISKKNFYELIRRELRNLPLNDQIESAVQNFLKDVPGDICGIHIRGTDRIKDVAHLAHSTREGFLKSVEENMKTHSLFYLATDDKETYEELHSLFPSRMLSYCTDFDTGKLRQTSLEQAFIDLILLSHTKKIIGTHFSSFSTCASLYGNIPIEWAKHK